MSRKLQNIAIIMLTGLLLIIPFYFVYKGLAYSCESKKRKAAWSSLEKKVKREVVSFRGETGLLIKDLSAGWEISYAQNKLFPSASLVKIPIMAAYYYAANKGIIKLEEKVMLKENQKTPGSGRLKYSPCGEDYSVSQLIELMITESDNTAANILIDLLGFEYLNDTFKTLGLKNTNLSRKMMDFSERREGVENFTTVADISYLLDKIYRKELINSDISEKCLSLLRLQKLRDRIPARLPVSVPVAHKTGLERGICHDAGIVFTENGDFLICVLVKHKNKVASPAKKFIALLALLTYNYYQSF